MITETTLGFATFILTVLVLIMLTVTFISDLLKARRPRGKPWINWESEEPTLPRYRCHKEVRAARIDSINRNVGPGRVAFLTLYDDVGIRYSRMKANAAWIAKHQPFPGGYIVFYEDGYISFSPSAPFESGYKRIGT